MTRTSLANSIAFMLAAATAAPAFAALGIGQPAPDFSLTDSNGAPHRLAEYRGRTVVLEWNNPDCPFVGKHYNSGAMQATQRLARGQGVVWLTIDSSASGRQGYMTAAQANAYVAKVKAAPTAYLLDPQGQAGHLYQATTTPDMYIVDKAGTLVYRGGIDDKPTTDPADLKTARNHVRMALAEIAAGKPVSVPETRSYGCSVKYSE